MSTLPQDLVYGLRVWAKTPALALVAALSLALGIGANTTIFSVVNALLLRPVPVRDPDRLVSVFTSWEGGRRYSSISYPDYEDIRDRNEVFTGVAAYALAPISLSGQGRPEVVLGEAVTANYFAVVGAEAAMGRTFLPEEEGLLGENNVCVISHGLWQRRFGSDPAIIGLKVVVSGYPFTVVGVAERGFTDIWAGMAPDIWVPMSTYKRTVPYQVDATSRANHWLQLAARRKPGAGLEQAAANLNMLQQQLAKEYPETNQRKQLEIVPAQRNRLPLALGMGDTAPLFLLMLLAVVGLVLLIACSNVANLLLAKAGGRQKEIAIRLAVGASRWQIVRQLLTESLALGLVGGGLGVLLAVWGTSLLERVPLPSQVPVAFDLSLDVRVLAFAFALAVGTGILFGLAPALQTSAPSLIPALKDQAGGGPGETRTVLRRSLVSGQVALSLVLLVGAGLFLRSMSRAAAIDPGFDAQNLLLLSVNLGLQGYDEPKGRRFFDDLLQRVRSTPGVEAASIANMVLLGGFSWASTTVSIPGYEPQTGEWMSIGFNRVAPGYFETLRAPIVSGRAIDELDAEETEPVVVINETMATRYWKDDPVGQTVDLNGRQLRVIGVAKDGKYRTLGEQPQPFMYFALRQSYAPWIYLYVRTPGAPAAMTAAVLQQMQVLDANLPAFDIKTMSSHVGLSLLPARMASAVFGLFGLLALVLTAVGIYGVMSYSVSRRVREIGIRAALGASRTDVVRLILARGLRMTLAGVLAGLAGALAMSRVVANFLHDTSPFDAVTFGVVSAVLLGVAMLGCYLPARRAARIEPMTALHHE
jgi:predicted permease